MLRMFAFLLLFMALHQMGWARPEYALKTATVSCQFCHVNPFGGGARTNYGKNFGARNFALSQLAQQDFFSADFRALGYLPRTSKTNVSGFGLLAVFASVNAPVSTSEDSIETRLVASFTSPEILQDSLNAYVLLKPSEKLQFMIGKFYLPFGLMTDEHRTYVRMQSNSSYRDYQYGFALSHNFFQTMHLDLTYTNDFASAKMTSEPSWQSLINFRWTPYLFPVFFGYSNSFYDRPSAADSRAQSFYSGLSLDRLTDYQLPLSILFELSLADGWNSNMNRLDSFVGSGANDTAYKAAVASSTSQGALVQVSWDYNRHWTWIYKFDQLMFDQDYPADAFDRHGLGFNYQLNGQSLLQVRYDASSVGRADLDPTAKNSFDSIYFVLRSWL